MEARAKVNNFDSAKKKLDKDNASFVKESFQIDRVFGHKKFLDANNFIVEGGLSARIRLEDGKTKLEFKEICRKGTGFEVSCELKEKIAELFLAKLGFEEAFCVKKRRQMFFSSGFEICLDSVEGLGNFIEVEKKITDEAEKETSLEACKKFLVDLDSTAALEPRKYGDLAQEKINNDKRKKP